MEPDEIRRRLGAIVDDFEKQANKLDGAVPDAAIQVAKTLLGAAKEALPDDPVVRVVGIPERAKYSDLVPTLRQVVLALPQSYGIG